MIKVRNEALAEKEKRVLEAEGGSDSYSCKSRSASAAINLVGNALASKEGQIAAQLEIARDYVDMYGDMGQKSNTIMFQKDAGDVNGLLAQAATVFNTASLQTSKYNDEENKNSMSFEMLEADCYTYRGVRLFIMHY